MSAEIINKFQPDRTLYLRGFTGFGAAAALTNASPTGFTVTGIFRDMADFCVLNLYDADNTYEHYSVRYLPDFNLSGLVLQFDVTYNGLQPLDSSKYSWIDWAHLDLILQDETRGKVHLWQYAQLVAGNYSVASDSCKLSTGNAGCTKFDRLTLFVGNAAFDFIADGGETAGTCAQTIAGYVNACNWSQFQGQTSAVLAQGTPDGTLTLKNARFGNVKVSGTTVTIADDASQLFPGIASGSSIYIGGVPYEVAVVIDARTLQLNSATQLADGSTSWYTAEYGGVDGNSVTAYFVPRTDNVNLNVDVTVLPLTGGNSEGVTWRVSLDFSNIQIANAAGGLSAIDRVRQAWLTFAPQLTKSDEYQATEWQAIFSNWQVSDPHGTRPFRCAGPGSVRVGSSETSRVTYTGPWQLAMANNLYHGFARTSDVAGSTVTITYQLAQSHDLYLGTALYASRGAVSVTLDGTPIGSVDCGLQTDSDLMARRLLAPSVPAGSHTVVLTVSQVRSLPFVFDYLEAAVPGDFLDATVTYNNLSPALDFDTDATYKVSPQRLFWHIKKLGFRGPINEYLGVFWWNQRRRNTQYSTAVVDFNAVTWVEGDVITINVGSVEFRKPTTRWDSVATVGAHFAYLINSGSISIRAEPDASGVLRIITRTPDWAEPLPTAPDTRIKITGTLAQDSSAGAPWIVDTAAAEPLNVAARAWHADFYKTSAQAGLTVTTSLSMEIVNPPDDGQPGNEWVARYADERAVTTDTGFQNLLSSQCAPVPNLTSYQSAAFRSLALLQQSSGLQPWLQFGEFLWWFYSSSGNLPIEWCSFTDPINIGFGSPHKLKTGDRVVISGVQGCTAANGTWTITVTDDTHFTIPVSGNSDWTPHTGFARGGSMAYYDTATAAAAQSVLGRPLFVFTCQDDDPGINDGADAQFLAARLKAHVDAIRQAVLAAVPETRFELLYPNDVNRTPIYSGSSVSYPQGGKLNAAVNLPMEWRTKATSGFDRLKVEALSWGATYANLTLSEQAISFACTTPMNWNASDAAYLVPWFNGTCRWIEEYSQAQNLVSFVNFWAYDHLAMMSWPLPLPSPNRSAKRQG